MPFALGLADAHMTMSSAVRKFSLAMHVSSSVGWLGAVAAFLALAIAGLTRPEPQLVRAAYLAMHLVTWYVIVPLSMAALVTGFVQSLGTPWGLFRHYWVVTKLLLTVVATLILLLHTGAIEHVADAAGRVDLRPEDLRGLRIQLVGDASAALFVLFATTMLSVYKPWGLTPYGVRRQYESAAIVGRAALSRRAPAGKYALLAIIGFFVVVLLLHLAGLGLSAH